MKKIISIMALAVLMTAFSTEAFAGRFGVKAGMNVTNLNMENVESMGALGYSAGITWQWNLPLWFAIQPDLMYHVKAATLDEAGSKLSMGTVEFVPNIQWGPRFANKNIRVFAQASPFIGYAVTKNATSALDGVSSDMVQDFLDQYGVKGDWETINRLSYGCGLGVGVQLWFLQLTAQYVWNFGNIASIGDVTAKSFNESNFGGYNVTLAFMFGGKKK